MTTTLDELDAHCTEIKAAWYSGDEVEAIILAEQLVRLLRDGDEDEERWRDNACGYCKEPFDEGDEIVSSYLGDAHEACYEANPDGMDPSDEEEAP